MKILKKKSGFVLRNVGRNPVGEPIGFQNSKVVFALSRWSIDDYAGAPAQIIEGGIVPPIESSSAFKVLVDLSSPTSPTGQN